MTDFSIQVENLSYAYTAAPNRALSGVYLEVREGTFVALVGANNSGKSTLCQALTGFIPHFHGGEMNGHVLVQGLNTTSCALSELVQVAGLVFQNPCNQLSGTRFTVQDEVAFGLENFGVSRREMRARIENILNLVGIADLADYAPHHLSGGQQQLVALAAMLVLEHPVLVLDEPTSALDPAASRHVFEILRQWSRQGRTVVLAERKLQEIACYCDRAVALAQGRIVFDGHPSSVLAEADMETHGIGRTRYTQVAAQAAVLGLWPSGRPLPVTLETALTGFGRDAQEDLT